MKVFLAATSLLPAYGGPAFSVSRLAVALAQAGCEVGLWAADESATTTTLLPLAAGVVRLTGDARDAIQGFKPDVLHDNGLWLTHNHRLAAIARAMGLPRVVSTRGMLEPWALRHKRWKKRLAWWLYQQRDLRRAQALHATAAPEADQLTRLGIGPPIWTIPNGMDLPPQPNRRRPAANSSIRTALFLGRIYPVKGLPMLLQAWARVRPRGWRLVLAGPDEAGHLLEVQRAVAAAGLDDVVSFPGALHGEAKAAALNEADLFVLPTLSESFGMAVAEALAHGVPVLTTTGAPWPALVERSCGWWVAPTVDGLAEGLNQAAACDTTTLEAMGARGRDLIRTDFTWESVAARFHSAYDRLLSADARSLAAPERPPHRTAQIGA